MKSTPAPVIPENEFPPILAPSLAIVIASPVISENEFPPILAPSPAIVIASPVRVSNSQFEIDTPVDPA